MKLILCLLLLPIICQAQIKTQSLLDKGYSIASKSATEVVTNPLQIYGANNFFIVIRLHVTADTVMGEYATSHRAHYENRYAFKWVQITNRRQCKQSWPVYRDFLTYWKEQNKL